MYFWFRAEKIEKVGYARVHRFYRYMELSKVHSVLESENQNTRRTGNFRYIQGK